MSQPRSHLTFSRLEPAETPPNRVVIAIHGMAGHPTDLRSIARSFGSRAELWLLKAPRPSMFGRGAVGNYWYIGERDGRPDPPTFGDTLFQIEQFVLDVVDRNRETGLLPILLGVDQGAVLALGASKVLPDYLGGVVAIGGYLPHIPGAELPVDQLDGLPILMINAPRGGEGRRARDGAKTLAREGALVELRHVNDARDLSQPVLEEIIAGWSRGLVAAVSEPAASSPPA